MRESLNHPLAVIHFYFEFAKAFVADGDLRVRRDTVAKCGQFFARDSLLRARGREVLMGGCVALDDFWSWLRSLFSFFFPSKIS